MESNRATVPWLARHTTVVAGALWIVGYFTARGILGSGASLGTWPRVAVALGPLPFFVIFLLSFVRDLRGLDELQRRIQVESFAVAFACAMLLLMTLGLLQRAIALPFEDWSYAHVWAYLPLFYVGALAFISRKYR